MQQELTIILRKAATGDQKAASELYQSFYQKLKVMALQKMKNERGNHTLGATGLVHEAYMKLINVNQIEWQDRKHFFAMASNVMRQILIDYAREKIAQKRGGDCDQVYFDEEFHSSLEEKDQFVLELDEALKELAKFDARKAKIVEMKFFGGFEIEEIAELEGISTPTVKRDWAMARAWIFNFLKRVQ